jgi:hypothetical protein
MPRSPTTPRRTPASGRRACFFGHQSIGANTLEGMAALGFAAPWVHWDFPESADYNGGAYFGQEYVGQNGDPKGKAAAFRSFMIDAGYGGRRSW